MQFLWVKPTYLTNWPHLEVPKTSTTAYCCKLKARVETEIPGTTEAVPGGLI